MGQESIDRNKFMQWMGANGPMMHSRAPLLIIDQGRHRGGTLEREYYMLLSFEGSRGSLHLSLTSAVSLSHLYHPQATIFTAGDLVGFATGRNKLGVMLIQYLLPRLERFNVRVSWLLDSSDRAPPIDHIHERAELGAVKCFLDVLASLQIPGTYYHHQPYRARTDDPVPLQNILTVNQLDDLWQACRVGPIRFREFF